MRVPASVLRWAAAVGVACALLVVLLLGPGTSGSRSGASADSTYRVDAIFDNAKGIIPGQLVKIAGARVGTIKDVVLTPDFKARIQMQIDRRFAPFRKDARCEIQPEGLISERFVQCEPGTPDAGSLEPTGDNAATVPVTRTSAPVAITDLFNVFRLPVRQRLSVLLTSLGIGLAGRGDDVNDILRRANPALALTRRALTILGQQRKALADTVTAADQLTADLARRPQSVTNFIDAAASVSATTAQHRTALEQAVQRLPGLLDQTQPTLERLDRLAADGTPVLRDLRAATPALASVVDEIKPFSEAGIPAVERLGAASSTGLSTVKAAKPVARLLKTFASSANPTGTDLNRLVVSLQANGGIEYLLKFIQNAAAAQSRYDGTSHLLPAHVIVSPCSTYSETPVAGCSANYGPTTAAKRAKPRRTHRKGRTPAAAAQPAAPSTAPASPSAPSAPSGPTLKLPGLPPIQLPSLPGLLGPGTNKDAQNGVGDLLHYLLGS